MISVKTAAAEIVKTVESQELRHNELFSAPGGVSCDFFKSVIIPFIAKYLPLFIRDTG